MSGKYRLLLASWGALFLASTLILFVNLQSSSGDAGTILPPFPGFESGTEEGDKPAGGDLLPEDGGTQWSLILSTASAFISAAGFMATTYFAMRNDHRQAALTELEVQKLAHEIERQRLEIDQLRRSQQNQEEQPPE